jgi:hypothetical protein
MVSGVATSAYAQKFGAKNAVAVSTSQVLRRRDRSSGSMNNKAIGFATRKTVTAITKTTTNSLRL